MLKLAHPYQDELKKLMAEASIDPRYMYYFTQPVGGYFDRTLSDNTVWNHDFVSISGDKIVGYIGYSIDAFARSANNFGLLSFDIGNPCVIRDTYKAIRDIFEMHNMNRMCWHAIVDNPVTKSYRRICREMGGRENGYERQSAMLTDGKLHDSISFEVLAEEYFQSEFFRRGLGRSTNDG